MKTIVTIIAAMLLISICKTSVSQTNGVGINSTGATPAPSAMLDVSSATSGLLIPRMTEVQKAAIASPAMGLMIYQTDGVQGFWYYNGSVWVQAVGPAGATGAIGPTGANGALNAWGLSGNAGTDSTVNFAGTTDAEALVFKTNNSERVRINKVGRVGIGNAPNHSAMLDVASTTSGLLIPRMTTAQRNAIASPAVGLQVYNTDCNGLNYYNGSCWLSTGTSLPAPYPITSNASTSLCANSTATYTVPAVTGATSYNWTVPAGAIITSGLGTTSIGVTYGNSPGEICVAASNACETSYTTCMDIQINANLPVSVSLTAYPPGGILPGTNVTFVATPVNGGTPTYQWKLNGGSVGTNSPTYSNALLNNGDFITCTITSNSTCVTSSPATSNTITMGVTTPVSLNISTSTYNGREVYSYAGGNQTFSVPSYVTQIFVKLWGAGGGGGNAAAGGSGAFVSGYLAVTPSSALTVIVGGAGIFTSIYNTVSPGGFGGGGASGSSSSCKTGSGGGRTTLQITPGTDAVTAGAGGGGSYSYSYNGSGGGGGATTGAAGFDVMNSQGGVGAGKGGTTSAGGAATTGGATNSIAGSYQTGSAGANNAYGGGGGGGGYYGGSGGAGNTAQNSYYGGGGGGASYLGSLTSAVNGAGNQANNTSQQAVINPTDVDYINGVGVGGGSGANGGNGLVVIYW